jgi:hypothetical protein
MIDQEFLRLCLDPTIAFNPHRLGFIPRDLWSDSDVRFGDLVQDFFQRKNNVNSRFYHKLYNALKITSFDSFYFNYIGVEWISPIALKVDKRIFAQLLGIRAVEGSLFHRQGNFPSHGFVELTLATAAEFVEPTQLEGIDFDVVRVLVHQDGVFVRGATWEAIENCKWVHASNRD